MASPRPLRSRGHDDGTDRWHVVEAPPDPALRGRVSLYSDYSERIASFTTRRELAGTTGVLIFALGEPLEIVGADGAALTVRAGEAFVGGIADATSLSRGGGEQAGLHVFMPLDSLAAVCAAPLAEIANRVAPLGALIGQAARETGLRLVEADGPEQRFALLDAFLLRRFAEAPATDPITAWAMAALASARAPASSRLAVEAGWSRRHFAARFRAETGFAPERFRRLVRFERFAAALAREPQAGLAELAAECGYADQPHLVRDVRDFAATTPGELRARLLPASGGVRHD